MKQRYIFIFFVLFLSLHTFMLSQNMKMGVNLVDGGAFINIINHTNRYNKCSSFDENGWPQSDFELVLMDGRPVAEWNNSIDDPEQYRIDYSGTYKCSFTGSADVSVWGSGSSIQNFILKEQNNKCTFDLLIPAPPSANHGLVILTFKNTARSVEGATNRGITNLRVTRPGYEHLTSQIFTNEFIDLCKSANFSCYRYYNVQNIWSGEPTYPIKTLWQNRKTPVDACQQDMTNLNGKKDGWSWEYIIELSNILKRDIWVCIHISSDSNYVTNLAKMLKEQLDPSINIYVENSNEVWSSTHMTHGPYNKSQADEFGISFDENYARRSVELSNWFSEVFGKEEINNRIRVVLAGQHAYPGRHDLHLNYINRIFGAPKQFIHSLSTALYFVSTKETSVDTDEINNGMIEDIDEQISNSSKSTYRHNHINKAKEWNLIGGCNSYEGGPHMPAGGGTSNLGNQILSHRTKKMGIITKYNYQEAWHDLGGNLAMYFTLWSPYTRYGCWGLSDDFNNPDRNYKMQAIRELIGEWTETKVNDCADNNINIYPNPSQDYLIVQMNELNSKKIEILNYYGFKIKSKINVNESNKNTIRIDLSAIPAGFYFIKISNSESAIIKPFIKL